MIDMLSKHVSKVQVQRWEGVKYPIRLMGRLPLIVSYVLILLKAYSTFIILDSHTHQHTSSKQHDIISSQTLAYIYHASYHISNFSIHLSYVTLYHIQGRNIDTVAIKYVYYHIQRMAYKLAYHVHQNSRHIHQDKTRSHQQTNTYSCECMSYFIASQHLCVMHGHVICMFMAKRKVETLN